MPMRGSSASAANGRRRLSRGRGRTWTNLGRVCMPASLDSQWGCRSKLHPSRVPSDLRLEPQTTIRTNERALPVVSVVNQNPSPPREHGAFGSRTAAKRKRSLPYIEPVAWGERIYKDSDARHQGRCRFLSMIPSRTWANRSRTPVGPAPSSELEDVPSSG